MTGIHTLNFWAPLSNRRSLCVEMCKAILDIEPYMRMLEGALTSPSFFHEGNIWSSSSKRKSRSGQKVRNKRREPQQKKLWTIAWPSERQHSFLICETLCIFLAVAQVVNRRMLTRLYAADRVSGTKLWTAASKTPTSRRPLSLAFVPYFDLNTITTL